MKGKKAIVVGANGGIAEASAELFVRDGADVYLMARNQQRLETLRARLLEIRPDAKIGIRAGETTSEASVRDAVQAAHEFFEGHLDVAVSTVGEAKDNVVLELDLDQFLTSVGGSLHSTFSVIRHSAPLMQKGGSIVCISSTAAKLPFRGMAGYCAGKAALEQLVRVAALEFGPRKIRVNAVRPGLTGAHTTVALIDHEALLERFLTEIPLGRTGASDDIAQAVRYLAGPESAWVTGQSFAVDGGNELRRAPDFPE